MGGKLLPQQILRRLKGTFHYAIRVHEKKLYAQNAGVPGACEYSVFDALDFEIQTIADLAPITVAGGQ